MWYGEGRTALPASNPAYPGQPTVMLMSYIKSGFIIALVGLVVIFTLQNTEVLSVEFLFWSFSLRRAVLLFAVLIVGIVTGYVLAAFHRNRAGSHGAKGDTDN